MQRMINRLLFWIDYLWPWLWVIGGPKMTLWNLNKSDGGPLYWAWGRLSAALPPAIRECQIHSCVWGLHEFIAEPAISTGILKPRKCLGWRLEFRVECIHGEIHVFLKCFCKQMNAVWTKTATPTSEVATYRLKMARYHYTNPFGNMNKLLTFHQHSPGSHTTLLVARLTGLISEQQLHFATVKS